MHVRVDPALALPGCFRYVNDYLWGVDPQLRLRRSVDNPQVYVLERQVQRSRPIQTSQRMTDRAIQARDGYIHVTTVHPLYLEHPARIVAALRSDHNDLWAEGGAKRWCDEAEAEEAAAKQRRRAARKDNFRAIAAEGFDILDRTGGVGGTERTRMNNPGVPTSPGPPAPESTDSA